MEFTFVAHPPAAPGTVIRCCNRPSFPTDTLKRVLGEFNYRNLDEVPVFTGRNTTTEVVARHIFDQFAAAIRAGELGTGAAAIGEIHVTLHESHVASAGYEGSLS